MSGDEHRQAPRVTRSFMIRYRCPEAGQTGWSVSPLRDLSRTGARLLSEQPYDIGTLLEVQLVLPISKEPVALQARVARKQSAQFGMVELGVTFVFESATPMTQQALEQAVSFFLGKQERDA